MIAVLAYLVIFGIAFWLGCYLLNRDIRDTRLCFGGLGLIAYGLGWAGTFLSGYAPTPVLSLLLMRVGWLLFFLPPLFWIRAMLGFLPDETWWQNWSTIRQSVRYRGLLVALLFFALSTISLLFPQLGVPRLIALLLVGGDLLWLGAALAIIDAFEQGETLLPDLVRSFDFSWGAVFLFAGPVFLVMLIATGITFPMLVLFFTTTALALATQTFSRQIEALVDKLAFLYFPRLRKVQQARAELRTVADALPRVNTALRPDDLDEDEFLRLTRQALRSLGDLSHLTASPLATLPLVEQRLLQRGVKEDAIERAMELKALLIESVARLKPRNEGEFGTSSEWRYYNALYFPYVVGLKPYSRRTQTTSFDATNQAALEWFRVQVPERTLHNWQTAATKLVAQDIHVRER